MAQTIPDQAPSPDDTFDGDWQRLWFSLPEWTSLAVVPTEAGVNAINVARGLVAVGQRTRSVHLVDATDARLEDVEELIETVADLANRGDLVIISVSPIVSHPAAIPIIRAASGALLVVRIPDSHLSSARNTVKAIGKEHIVGSVVLS